MAALRSFTLSMAGNWFCEPVEKIAVFLAPLRNLKLPRWRLVLPNQPYYVEEVATIRDQLSQCGMECAVWFG